MHEGKTYVHYPLKGIDGLASPDVVVGKDVAAMFGQALGNQVCL